MSRRFSNEPINLIRRIPTQEQLDAARPVTQSFGEKLVETAGSFVRSVVERLVPITSPKPVETTGESNAVSEEELLEVRSESVAPEFELSDREISASEERGPGLEEAVSADPRKWSANPLPAALPSVQPEEVAELRAYLLSQQQDIARLAAQIQELKSLVASQQQIIEYLGKEVDAGSVSLLTAAITSAVAKQNRSASPKPVMKDKAVVSKGDPIGLPLNV